MAVVTLLVLKSYFNDGDVPTESNYIDLVDTLSGADWDAITNKPSTFTPSAHTHGGGDITSAVANAVAADFATNADDADTLDGVSSAGFHKTTENIVNSNDVRIGGGIVTGSTLVNPAIGTGHFRASGVAGTYGPHSSMDNVLVEQNGPAGITFIVPGGSSAYIARIDRTESDLWRQGIRFNDYNGIDLFCNNVYSLQAFSDRVYIYTDLRVANGLYVGADSNPENDCVHVTGDVKVGSGLVVGSLTATPATGEIRFYTSSCVLSRHDAVDFQVRISTADGYVAIGPKNATYCHFTTDRANYYFDKPIAANGDGRFAGGIAVGSYTTNPNSGDLLMSGGLSVGTLTDMATAGQISAGTHLFMKAGTSNSYALVAFKDTQHGHLYLQDTSQLAYIYLNWYGSNSTYPSTTRIGNGNQGWGNIHADNFVNESIRDSKRNVRSLKDDLQTSFDLIKELQPIKYQLANPNATRPEQDRLGFIAEDLINWLPEVVAIDPEGQPEGIDYGQITPLLTVVIQELIEKVEHLENLLT